MVETEEGDNRVKHSKTTKKLPCKVHSQKKQQKQKKKRNYGKTTVQSCVQRTRERTLGHTQAAKMPPPINNTTDSKVTSTTSTKSIFNGDTFNRKRPRRQRLKKTKQTRQQIKEAETQTVKFPGLVNSVSQTPSTNCRVCGFLIKTESLTPTQQSK